MYVSATVTETGDYNYDYSIVDDKNVEGNTLGVRRLRLLEKGNKLKKLSKAIYFIGDVIKLGKKGTWFIDNSGYLFTYVKSRRVPLTFHKIAKIVPIQTGGALIEIKGLPGRFKTLHNPLNSDKYAGILIDGMKYVLYGLFPEKHQNTHRAV